jgi:hemerythrin
MVDNIIENEYRSGHPVIDFQHKLLFTMISKLKSSLKAGKSVEVLEEAVQFFDCFMVEHFADEEELQKEVGFPKYEEHKQQHIEMWNDFLEMKAKIDKWGANHLLAVESLKLISDWMKNHFREMDKEFIGYLRKYMENHQRRKPLIENK